MNENEPAFPSTLHNNLSKRELFAALALVGFVASPLTRINATNEELAQASIALADALIAKLNRSRTIVE